MLNEVDFHKAVEGLSKLADREGLTRLSGPGNKQCVAFFGKELL
jgi:hypothetical protein